MVRCHIFFFGSFRLVKKVSFGTCFFWKKHVQWLNESFPNFSYDNLGGGFKYFLFSPLNFGKAFTQFDGSTRIFFQRGLVVKNHQLVMHTSPPNDFAFPESSFCIILSRTWVS